MNDLLIEEIRKMALESKDATEIIIHISSKLNCGREKSIEYPKYLMEAFKMSLTQAKTAFAWEYFDGSLWDEEDVNNILNPVIEKRLWL